MSYVNRGDTYSCNCNIVHNADRGNFLLSWDVRTRRFSKAVLDTRWYIFSKSLFRLRARFGAIGKKFHHRSRDVRSGIFMQRSFFSISAAKTTWLECRRYRNGFSFALTFKRQQFRDRMMSERITLLSKGGRRLRFSRIIISFITIVLAVNTVFINEWWRIVFVRAIIQGAVNYVPLGFRELICSCQERLT